MKWYIWFEDEKDIILEVENELINKMLQKIPELESKPEWYGTVDEFWLVYRGRKIAICCFGSEENLTRVRLLRKSDYPLIRKLIKSVEA